MRTAHKRGLTRRLTRRTAYQRGLTNEDLEDREEEGAKKST